MDFDDETIDAFDKVLDQGNELLEDALAMKLDEKLGTQPLPLPTVPQIIEAHQRETLRLRKIIEDREHDIDCLTSENVTLRDENAGFKDEIGELKRKIR